MSMMCDAESGEYAEHVECQDYPLPADKRERERERVHLITLSLSLALPPAVCAAHAATAWTVPLFLANLILISDI